jgi:hypothetical protein
VHGGSVEHISSWNVARSITRTESGFTADDFAHELPRMLGAGPKRADPPPAEWKRAR